MPCRAAAQIAKICAVPCCAVPRHEILTVPCRAGAVTKFSGISIPAVEHIDMISMRTISESRVYTHTIQSYDGGFLRNADDEEHLWILTKCRKAWDEIVGFKENKN